MFADSGVEVPELLHHYTDLGGFIGIIDSQRLWATHRSYLNDATEDSYASELVAEHAPSLLAEFGMPTDIDVSFRQFARRSNIFVTCFCADPDLLSQWRGYTAGRGVAIGLAVQRFANFSDAEQSLGLQLRRVVYDEPAQVEALRTRILGTISQLGAGVDELDTHYSIGRALSTAMLGFKHPGFREENEWRLVVNDPPQDRWRFRVGPQGLTPYVELDLSVATGRFSPGRLPVMEVVHGPTTEGQLAVEAVMELLKTQGYQQFEVRLSEIPFR